MYVIICRHGESACAPKAGSGDEYLSWCKDVRGTVVLCCLRDKRADGTNATRPGERASHPPQLGGHVYQCELVDTEKIACSAESDSQAYRPE